MHVSIIVCNYKSFMCMSLYMHTHNRMKAPRYKAILPKTGPLQRLVVKPEVREL